MNSPTFREIEQINTYLDGQLSQAEVARLENRLKNEPELAAAYQQLSQARSLLRQLPARRAPRNFTLTPKMAGVKAPTPRVFPVFRLASVVASFLLVLTFAANGIGQLATNAPAAPIYGIGGGGQPLEAEARPQSGGGNDQANTEAPAAAPAAPVAPAATEAPLQMVPLATDAAAPTAAPETMRTAAEPTTEATADTFQKTAPELPPEQPAVAQPPQPPFIPAWLQAGLLIVALCAAGLAGLVGWNAQRQFRRRNQ